MRLQLTAAGLLGTAFAVATLTPSVARADDPEAGTKAQTDFLFYSDTDSVIVFSPQVSVAHGFDDEGSAVSARYTVDAITAASVDVVSSASYRFSEVRHEVNLAGSMAMGLWLPGLSYRYSQEPDYVSHSVAATGQVELGTSDSVAGARYEVTFDRIGRSGTPASVFSENLVIHSGELSMTQVVDTKTVVRGVYTLTAESGYMEKPYRSVPLFAVGTEAELATQGIELGLDNFDAYRLAARPSEEVPDRRYRHALAMRGLRYVERIDSSLRLDYRLYADSWGMWAHTVEAGWAKQLTDRWSLAGFTRFHRQTAADFWRRTYEVEPGQVPRLRTADRSLSALWQSYSGVRGEFAGDSTHAYVEVAGMYSRFLEFLYLDQRFALTVQGGLRWEF